MLGATSLHAILGLDEGPVQMYMGWQIIHEMNRVLLLQPFPHLGTWKRDAWTNNLSQLANTVVTTVRKCVHYKMLLKHSQLVKPELQICIKTCNPMKEAREPVEIKGHIIARIQAEFIPCMNFPCRSPKLHVTIFYCTTEIICKVMKRVTGIIRSCHVVTLHYLAAVHKYLSPECTCIKST